MLLAHLDADEYVDEAVRVDDVEALVLAILEGDSADDDTLARHHGVEIVHNGLEHDDGTIQGRGELCMVNIEDL